MAASCRPFPFFYNSITSISSPNLEHEHDLNTNELQQKQTKSPKNNKTTSKGCLIPINLFLE